MVSGWLKNSLRQKRERDDSKFDWNDKDQGTIKGNIIELKECLDKSPFKNFKIETEVNYKWRSCNQAFQEPCPYYITALVSMVAPIGLALATFLIIVCWSKCYKQGNLIAVIFIFDLIVFPNSFFLLFRPSRHLWSSLEKSTSAVYFPTFCPFSEIFW